MKVDVLKSGNLCQYHFYLKPIEKYRIDMYFDVLKDLFIFGWFFAYFLHLYRVTLVSLEIFARHLRGSQISRPDNSGQAYDTAPRPK